MKISRLVICLIICTYAYVSAAKSNEDTTTVNQTETYAPETVRGWVSAYFEGTRSMDAMVWASAFSTDAVLDDPVGSTLKTTPEAILSQGEGFVSAFKSIGLHESFVHVVGNEAVAKWEGRGVTLDGIEVTFEGINHFQFNDSGKITQLRGFFSPPGS